MGRTKHDQLAFFLLDNYYSRRSNSPSDKNEDNEEGAIYDRETPESYDKHEYPDEPDPCSHGTLAASGKGIGHPGHYFVAVLAVRLEEITTAWVDSVDKLGKASKRERDRAKEAIYRAHGPNSSQKAKKEVARSEMRQEVLEEIANKLDNGLRSFESTFFAEGKMKLFRDDPDSGNRGVDQWVSRIENCHKKLTLCRGTLKDTVIPAEEKFCSHLRNDASLQMQERAEAFNNIVRGQQSQMIAVSLAVVFSLPVSLTSGIFSMDGMPIARTWPAFVVVMIGFWILIMVFYGGHTKFPWLRDQLSGLWEGRRPTRKPGRPPDGD